MSEAEDRIRREAARRMASLGMSRRQFLGRTGALLGGLAVGPTLLAACGGGDDDNGSGSGGGGGGGGGGKSIAISNWVGYWGLPSTPPGGGPLGKKFEQETGISLTYDEDINDNNEYFAKIRPSLSKDESIGRDGFVLTDWMANRLINQAKWVQEFDEAAFPNKANLRAALRSPGFDPQRLYSAPWASGVTGIAYNIEQTGKDIRTVDEFLAVDGTTTVLSEMRDTVGLFMRSLGIDTAAPNYSAAEPAFDKLAAAFDDGKIDGVNGNEYVNDLGAGNLAAAFSWSGDVAQITLDNPDVRFAVPESGGMLWSDNFMIPYTSDKADLASQFINFFYDPVNAAALTADIQFISPVDGVPEQLTAMGGAAAALVDNSLVVPTEESLAALSIFGPLNPEQEELFDARFAEITGTG
jgi:spermidine/putrescine transport system substrate-binding protein